MPAHGRVGARAFTFFSFLKTICSPAKRAMRAGKKKRGSGGNEFLPARPVWGWESVSAIPASAPKQNKFATGQAERQNRKIFFSLIEKNFGGAQLKNVKKIFLFCSLSGERKRWAGFLPIRAEIVAQKRFALRSVIATNRNLFEATKKR